MNSCAIKVEGLGKKYSVGEKQTGYKTIRDSLTVFAGNFSNNFTRKSLAKAKDFNKRQEFWALKDVGFEVKPGEVIGLIGRNGAGKSTLLKVLSRITEPSAGTVDIFGRVGSLLEVGTGFHSELSGRENTYLSGAILGMKKAEIDRQFDEIVAFSEIEKFIDTPVKHYSSGMYLRLAFAVAAHLQPEILLIDEVLAVGDAVFQKKCLGKMDDVAKQGRTVLFVSHNMSAIQELCGRGILINSGTIAYDGKVLNCIGEYYKRCSIAETGEENGKFDAPLRLSAPYIGSNLTSKIQAGQSFDVEFNATGSSIKNPVIWLMIENVHSQRVVASSVEGKDIGLETLDGSFSLKISVPVLWLAPGIYSLYVKLLTYSGENAGRYLSERLILEVTGDSEKTGKSILRPRLEFDVEKI